MRARIGPVACPTSAKGLVRGVLTLPDHQLRLTRHQHPRVDSRPEFAQLFMNGRALPSSPKQFVDMRCWCPKPRPEERECFTQTIAEILIAQQALNLRASRSIRGRKRIEPIRTQKPGTAGIKILEKGKRRRCHPLLARHVMGNQRA
jgi:hypothetical protein